VEQYEMEHLASGRLPAGGSRKPRSGEPCHRV